MGFKGHIAFRNGVPIKWSKEIFVIKKKRVSRELGWVKVFVDDRWRFWPSEVQVVPADSMESAVWGQDGNVDFVPPQQGARRSSRKKWKPVKLG